MWADIKTREQETIKWWLTQILYPDYKDGTLQEDNDPLNSKDLNRGTWFAIEYDSIEGYFDFSDKLMWDRKKTAPNSTGFMLLGSKYGDEHDVLTKVYYIKRIFVTIQVTSS